jgi:hypothetical protein
MTEVPAPPRTEVPPDATLRGRKGQNTSDAVMAQRGKQKDKLDDFPTPPWGTRALCEYVIGRSDCEGMTALEPAAGRGYMSEPLAEYFDSVTSADMADYGYPLSHIGSFIAEDCPFEPESFDWVITNPPFKYGQQFVEKALTVARVGVAMLCRTAFIETVGRYEMYCQHPLWRFAPFSERLPMIEGKVDGSASSATSYAWFVWNKVAPTLELPYYAGDDSFTVGYGMPSVNSHGIPYYVGMYIPPCRKKLERPQDYAFLPKDWLKI